MTDVLQNNKNKIIDDTTESFWKKLGRMEIKMNTKKTIVTRKNIEIIKCLEILGFKRAHRKEILLKMLRGESVFYDTKAQGWFINPDKTKMHKIGDYYFIQMK